MLRNTFLFLVFTVVSSFLMCSTSALAEEQGKLVVSQSATCAGQELQLNGLGTRKKLFLKLYVASLYVQEKQADAAKFLQMSQASCMRLNITSSKITAEKMVKAVRDGFNKSTHGNTAPIKTEIEVFLAWLSQPITKGDVFEFAFVPHNTMRVSKNDTELGVIESKAFSNALFAIWLGDMPADKKLKSGLLGMSHTVQ
jgi:hypothetical protein